MCTLNEYQSVDEIGVECPGSVVKVFFKDAQFPHIFSSVLLNYYSTNTTEM